MLNLKKIVGIIAMVAIIGFVFLSCEEETGAPGAPGLLKAPAISEAPAITGSSADVANMPEAEALFSELISGYFYEIWSGLYDAQEVAIKDKGFTSAIFYYAPPAADLPKKSVSYSFSFTDTTKLKAELGVDASVKETSKYTWKSSRFTLAEMFANSLLSNPPKPEIGDNEVTTMSLRRTVKIPTLFTAVVNDEGKIGGTFELDVKGNDSWTVKTKKGSGYSTSEQGYAEFSAGKNNSSTKFAAAVSFDNGSKAAKFRFSVSGGGVYSAKAAGWEGGNAISDIEVYNKAGTKIFTIPSWNVDSVTYSYFVNLFKADAFPF